MVNEKKIKIGLDLDGVLVGKPFFIPKSLLEWLVRSHKNKELAYRYPSCRFERWLRWLSHHYIFRPPIRKNLKVVRKLAKNRNYLFYLISGRYSFLEDRTYQWLKRYHLITLFEKISINLENEQPHKFKEKMIKKMKIEIFIDDDFSLIKYLAISSPDKKFFCIDGKKHKQAENLVCLSTSLEEIFNL